MRTPLSTSRRELLAGLAGASGIGLFAGCSGGSEGAEGDDGGSTAEPGDEGDGGSTASATGATPASELDLREANVVDVAFEADGESYTFDVALHHDDDGEDGYANWWQVERLDGTRLGRRELLHAHSRQPFTRSDTVEIPSDVSCVVVRGHDRTHGYGGRAVLVNLESGAARAVEQGPDRRPVDESDCP
ncbi:hypothetical protein [Halobellus limi]|uniref:Uncharacterized protein n=1 Tax=Halobellus limi TaxID=699433 RepID=A0A1H5WWA1_9EURY|nr:hypothetical protein [Halobellus limi]QCC46332.1 hypothetical protein DV707_00795 [Halobellus limi]SEG03247.1 hypothetical protein SAMN04488133_1404 [Halobellus limi]